MTINVGVIGCGKRFNELYIQVLELLVKEKKINLKIAYNRNISHLSHLTEKFNCKLTSDIKDIIENVEVDLIIITVPINLRNKIIIQKNFNPKLLLLEVPFSNNLGEYYFLKKKLIDKGIKFEVFEDRFFLKKYNFKNKVFKYVVNFNKEWKHHAIGALFNIDNKSKYLKKIRYYNNLIKDFDVYKLTTNKLSLLYIFSSDKKKANREKGFIKIYDQEGQRTEVKEKDYDRIKNLNDGQSSLYICIENFLQNPNLNHVYSYEFLEAEQIIVTMMKLMKKLKIKKVNKLSIIVIKNLFKIYGSLIDYGKRLT